MRPLGAYVGETHTSGMHRGVLPEAVGLHRPEKNEVRKYFR